VEALLAEGCVVVATSNRAPRQLERHGLHEALFSHFVDSLEAACDVVALEGGRDYRRLAAAAAPPLLPLGAHAQAGAGAGAEEAPPHASYFFPLGPAADAALERQWRQLAGAAAFPARGPPTPTRPPQPAAVELGVMFGRRLRVPRAAGGAAWFSFAELCAVPLGAADYLALAQAYHTLFLAGVPQLSMQAGAAAGVGCLAGLVQGRCRLLACLETLLPAHSLSGTTPTTHQPTCRHIHWHTRTHKYTVPRPPPPAHTHTHAPSSRHPLPRGSAPAAGPRPGPPLHHAGGRAVQQPRAPRVLRRRGPGPPVCGGGGRGGADRGPGVAAGGQGLESGWVGQGRGERMGAKAEDEDHLGAACVQLALARERCRRCLQTSLEARKARLLGAAIAEHGWSLVVPAMCAVRDGGGGKPPASRPHSRRRRGPGGGHCRRGSRRRAAPGRRGGALRVCAGCQPAV
jgi:hypothetical protein